MKLPGMVVVKEELSKLDADVVAAFLKSQGVNAIVSADDAGGEIPAFDETRFAQVLVAEEDGPRALTLIAEARSGSAEDEGEEDDE